MGNKFKAVFMTDFNENILSKVPMIVAVFLIYLATMLSLSISILTKEEIAGTTIVMILQLFVFLFSDTFFKNRYWIYFILQGIITFDYAVVVPHGFITILLGLIPILIIQSMSVYNEARKVVIAAAFFYCIFCGTIVVYSGQKMLRSRSLKLEIG